MYHASSKTVLNNDRKIALLVAFLWGYSALMLYIMQLIKIVTKDDVFAIALNYTFIGALVLLTAIPIFSRLSICDGLYLLATGSIFGLSLIFFPDNTDSIIGILPRFFFTVLPCYFIGRTIVDFKLTMKYLHVVSIVVLITNVAYFFYYLSSGRVFQTDNMDFAYNILPSVLILLYWALDKGGTKRWVIAVGGAFFIMMQGTRGPVACIVAFLVLYLLLMTPKRLSKGLFFMPFLLLGGFTAFGRIFTAWFQQIIVLLQKYNISTRVIQMLFKNEITDGTGRTYLYQSVTDEIKQHPIWGNGIMGDRVINGIYVHNLFLELLFDFGVLFGSLLIIILVILVWRSVRQAHDRDAKVFVITLIVLGVVKLMISSSYLNEPYFFLLIGMCLNYPSKGQRYFSKERLSSIYQETNKYEY